ncbi:MAG: hypothetical protein GY925_20850 [Actinomycetia bacterium]|nr:hypothetical protein [Actinomycetes bacterium]
MLYHPKFASQYEALASRAEGSDDLMELFGEISALLRALEDFGHDIEGDQPDDASHPIVISRFATYALRRTPPTNFTPYAYAPPVLRIPYVWFDQTGGNEIAVVMLAGDKAGLGYDWYPGIVNQIEGTMIPEWERRNPKHKAQVRRTR